MKLKIKLMFICFLLYIDILHCSKKITIDNPTINSNKILKIENKKIKKEKEIMQNKTINNEAILPINVIFFNKNKKDKPLKYRFKSKGDDSTNLNVLNAEILTSKP